LVTQPELAAAVAATRVGVTDGSTAPAGAIGQWMWVQGPAAVAMPANGTVVTLATLALTAGAWLVWGIAQVAGNYSTVVAGVSPAAAQNGQMNVQHMHTPAITSTQIVSVPFRPFNLAAAGNVFLTGWVTGGTGASSGQGCQLMAFRVR
jgi:hypothetical protein